MNADPIRELVRARCGLELRGSSDRPIEDAIRNRLAATGIGDESAYFLRLRGDDRELYELVGLLTINETYFFREPEQLSFFVEVLVPRLLAARGNSKPIRILSAGCSTGEEAYTLAIALAERYPENAPSLFAIVGGDIDLAALHRARLGTYRDFSFRAMGDALRVKYFRTVGAREWSVVDRIRGMVEFHHLNLLSSEYSAALRDFSAVFFRNVSIYFDVESRRFIQERLATVLRVEGCLLTGVSETFANDLGVFPLVEEAGIFYFSRSPVSNSAAARSARAPCAPSTAAPPAKAAENADRAFGALSEARGSDKAASSAVPGAMPGAKGGEKRAAIPATGALASGEAPVAARKAATMGEVVEAIREKRRDRAAALLEELDASSVGKNDAQVMRSYLALIAGDYPTARRFALEAIETEPWSTDAALVLGLAAKRQGDFESAVEWFRRVVYECHECWQAQYYLAELYRSEGHEERSLRAYRSALRALAGPKPVAECLRLLPLDLPAGEVRTLCELRLGAKA